MIRYFLVFMVVIVYFMSCKIHERGSQVSELYTKNDDRVWIVSQEQHISGTLIVDREVLIIPGGFFSSVGTGKIKFTGHVSVLGQQAIFDPELEVEFAPWTFDYISPNWFGANGSDNEDDSAPFQRMFDLISPGAGIQLNIPIGKYYISKQIKIIGTPGNNLAFVLHGTSTSYSGTNGSSLIWRGLEAESMFLISNTSQTIIENVDFNVSPGYVLKSNIEFRPNCNQISFRNCYFTGCSGDQSANVNLNEGSNLQVSELFFENCIFKGLYSPQQFTSNAIRGGWANTKNFHFIHCAFGPYRNEAIKIKTSDVLTVEGCTFYLNDIDISCETCKTLATSNYSEESGAFFMSTASANYNATTLINNQFTGKPLDGFVIRDGSGTLVLLNNNFGAGNYLPDKNFIRWEENDYNSIYSVGNVYKNATAKDGAFYNRSNLQYRKDRIFSQGDLGGVMGEGRVKMNDIQH